MAGAMEFTDDNYFRAAWRHNNRVARMLGGEKLQGCQPHIERICGLLSATGVPAQGTAVLELGSGVGALGAALAEMGYRYVGMDISEDAVAIARVRARAEEAGSAAEFVVGDVLDLSRFAPGEFPLVVDAWCFHVFVIDRDRAAYLRGVRRVLAEDGYLILLGAHDEDACDGPIESFAQFCEAGGGHGEGVPAGRWVDGEWQTVETERCYLMARAQSLRGYRREFADAGFSIEHEETFGKPGAPGSVAYVLRKASDQDQERNSV